MLEHKLFVGMLPKNVSETEVSALFSQYGTIKELQILRGSQQTSKGCYIYVIPYLKILFQYSFFAFISSWSSCYACNVIIGHLFMSMLCHLWQDVHFWSMRQRSRLLQQWMLSTESIKWRFALMSHCQLVLYAWNQLSNFLVESYCLYDLIVCYYMWWSCCFLDTFSS